MNLVFALGAMVVLYAPKLTGFVLPPLVDFINKDVKSDNTKFIISMVVCALWAILLDWNQLQSGTVTDTQLIQDAGLIWIESQALFKLYFQNSWLRGKLQGMLGSSSGQLG